MIVETHLSGEEKVKKFIYFNPYKKEIQLKTYNCGWWNDISCEIRDEHDNIILKVPSLEVDNFNFYDYLPINCSMPKIISTKGKIFLSPNEVNLGLFNNKFYGRHSTLFLELMIN